MIRKIHTNYLVGCIRFELTSQFQARNSDLKKILEERLMEELVTSLGGFKEPIQNCSSGNGKNGNHYSPWSQLQQEGSTLKEL